MLLGSVEVEVFVFTGPKKMRNFTVYWSEKDGNFTIFAVPTCSCQPNGALRKSKEMN